LRAEAPQRSVAFLQAQREPNSAQLETLQRISCALGGLPPLCRRAFILVRYRGMSFEAAAAQLGLHPRKVRRYVQRAFASCERAIRG